MSANGGSKRHWVGRDAFWATRVFQSLSRVHLVLAGLVTLLAFLFFAVGLWKITVLCLVSAAIGFTQFRHLGRRREDR